MCEHHHAAKHILCSQCDMLVALPRLEHGQKAACPRCGTTLTVAWDAPRQRPTAYALAALFMLLLSNLFPFVNMNVAGVTSAITCNCALFSALIVAGYGTTSPRCQNCASR